MVANNSLTANFSLFRKLPYDPFKDFVPIAMGATSLIKQQGIRLD